MGVTNKDYVVVKGYVFDRQFKAVDGSISGWDFRFTIYTQGGADIVAVAGSGLSIDDVAGNWTLDIPTDNLPVGQHRYSHDYKTAGGNWRQISTGEFRVTDPRAML